MAQKVTYTQKDYNNLVAERDNIVNVLIPQNLHDIEVARGFGDLSENAEYSSARDEQVRLNALLADLEEKIKNAEVIDESKIDVNVISIGSIVKVFDRDMDEEDTYSIVSQNAIDPDRNCVSDMSPIGQALIGKKVGDIAVIRSPGGEYQLQILDVTRNA